MKKQSQLSQSERNALIRQAKTGDQQAFERLLSVYSPLLDSMAAKFADPTVSLRDYDDVRQEAIVGFYRALRNYDTEQDGVQFGLYARECIRNGLISYLRVTRSGAETLPLGEENESFLLPSEEDPAKDLVEAESYHALSDRVREALSPYENRIWHLYLSGRTAREIASLLGKNEKSVENAVFRIRKKLRAVIQPD